MPVMKIEKERYGIKIVIEALAMGEDLTVAITGGDLPHLGAAALGVPRPSLSDPRAMSASVSVLTITGHKEDEIVRYAAYKLAASLGRSVLVAGGIHIDNITQQGISLVRTLVDEILETFINTRKGKAAIT